MVTNGELMAKQWEYLRGTFVINWNAKVNPKGKFIWYFSPFVINGRSMEYRWEYFSRTCFDSVLMGVQFHTPGNILMVIISIYLSGEFNGISLRTL